ncbi:MAG: YHYH protein, partial [Acidobacteriota bacterium]
MRSNRPLATGLALLALTAALMPARLAAHDLLLSSIDIAGDATGSRLIVRTPLSHLAKMERRPAQAMSAVEADIAIRRRLALSAGDRAVGIGPSEIRIDPVADMVTWTATAAAANVRVTDPLFPEERAADTIVRHGDSSRIEHVINRAVHGFSAVGSVGPLLQAGSAQAADAAAAHVDASFKPFAPAVATHHDSRFFYVESDGMPDHTMMVGITAWQQQVPLPQNYTGNNAWRFPLFPSVAASPLSAKDHFFRGAIAMAANGVPIFNPIKNDGVTDTFIAGELDQFGGHGGRADDYHYHLAPLHLQKVLGNALPVAYALDGYAIYGLTEPDGSAPGKLDAFNGHAGADGVYHYHATKTYPYLNGGFHGDVVERDGQVDPQPNATPVRPSTEPLRGAVITGFEKLAGNTYTLTYTVRGETRKIRYTIQPNGRYVFDYIDGRGNTTTETYVAGRGRGRGGDN